MKAMRNRFDGLRLPLLLGLGVVWLCSTGCATVIHGANQMIPISTTPSGAMVQVDGQAYQSPCVLSLARRCDHAIVISKAGYCPETRYIARKATGATLGNIWAGGLIGMGVDAATGANYELVPDHLEVALAPDDGQGGRPLAQAPPAGAAFPRR